MQVQIENDISKFRHNFTLYPIASAVSAMNARPMIPVMVQLKKEEEGLSKAMKATKAITKGKLPLEETRAAAGTVDEELVTRKRAIGSPESTAWKRR
jgi:hypothetical protein